MKKVLMFCLLILSVACQSSSSDKAASLNPGGSEHSAKVDTTPYSECDRGTPTRQLQGAWTQSFEDNGFSFQITFEFLNNSVRMTNNCHFQGRSLTASTSSMIDVTPSELSVLETTQDEEHINEGGFNMNCDVQVHPMKVLYSFKGSCLVMQDEQTHESMTLIPVR